MTKKFHDRKYIYERWRDVTTYQQVQGATLCSLLSNSIYNTYMYLPVDKIFSTDDPRTWLDCLHGHSRYERATEA